MKADPAKFITRGAYRQAPCYALWLAAALDKLYEHPPENARELVENAADFMKPAPGSALWKSIGKEGAAKISNPTPQAVFGPVAEKDYGIIEKDRDYFYTYEDERDYRNILNRNYPRGKGEAFKTLPPFTYRVPGKGRDLELMRIGQLADLMGNAKMALIVAFKHPKLTPAIYDDFIGCLEPLFDAAHKGDKDAVVTFYWLMAQMTPAKRGGTAHARLALEYLASQAGMEILHTRPEYDLWAEAASTPLEVFKARFIESLQKDAKDSFFDPRATSEVVLRWQQEQLRRPVPHGGRGV